jgi:hypothetical protein
MPVAAGLTTTSVGPGVGSGTSSTAIVPGVVTTAALT